MTRLYEFIDPKNNKPWLEVEYKEKKQRTYNTGKQAIDELVKQGKRVSYRSIEATSKMLDPSGKGIHANTVKTNEALYQYYLRFSRLRKTIKSQTKVTVSYQHLKVGRDLSQVRRRYMNLSRQELADRLIQAEEYIAEQQTKRNKSRFEQFQL
ncbi:hypothetical protein P5G65_23675 [Paenibacillus chondroitinus]|uniref:Uncharacterized protein n=1 Tax=Paenibacillus chondroitinus TaxID=59842 RepID=A0ABU6DGL3_9BACL|nr:MULTISPECIES: hypothetical protein [Paenibacillus]MCY9659509.1 hypothetical protein [Paenibacillus anseongense]MEB4796904.1 hypothetical protein [Paenibacillus chondroitinus]